MPSHVTYDPACDAAYIYLRDIKDGEAVHQAKTKGPSGDRIILDFDAEHRLIGIEVLGAKSVLPPSILAVAGPPEKSDGWSVDEWGA